MSRGAWRDGFFAWVCRGRAGKREHAANLSRFAAPRAQHRPQKKRRPVRTPPDAICGTAAIQRVDLRCRLAGRFVRLAARLAVAHEPVELFLVLGPAQFAQIVVELVAHLVELAALFLETFHLGIAPVVEGDVAGARRSGVAAMAAPAGGPAAAGENVVRRPVHVAFEAVEAVTPDDVGEHRQSERPEHHEAQHHQCDGRGRPGRTDQCICGHRSEPRRHPCGRIAAGIFDLVGSPRRFKKITAEIGQLAENASVYRMVRRPARTSPRPVSRACPAVRPGVLERMKSRIRGAISERKREPLKTP